MKKKIGWTPSNYIKLKSCKEAIQHHNRLIDQKSENVGWINNMFTYITERLLQLTSLNIYQI